MQGLTEDMCYNINNVEYKKRAYTLCTPPEAHSFVFIVVAEQNQKLILAHFLVAVLLEKRNPNLRLYFFGPVKKRIHAVPRDFGIFLKV